MAIAQRRLAVRYNKPDFAIFDYDIYAVCGDGCLMEGKVPAAGAQRPRPPTSASITYAGSTTTIISR